MPARRRVATRVRGLRRQLPAYSPLTFRDTWRSAAQAVRLRHDPRPRVRELVRALYQAEDALLVDSGTHALELAIRTAHAILGGPYVVALPAYTCYDMAAAAVGAGATVALYDLDPAPLAPDLDSLTATLAEGARIVVVAPLYGVPVDWEAIERCVAPFGAIAIEDAAQGHGATWRGCPLGSLGQLSTLSFGRGKGWTAGQGGAFLTRGGFATDASVVPSAGVSAEFRVLCRAVAQAALARPETYALPAALPWLHLGETRYRPPVAVRRMGRVAAALLERTLPLATREAATRRANVAALLGRLRLCSHIRTVAPPLGGVAGYLRLPVRLSRGLAGFRDPRLALRLGVAPGYPTTLAALGPVRERLARANGRWPGAEDLVRELVTLPTHSAVDAADREALAGLMEQYGLPSETTPCHYR